MKKFFVSLFAIILLMVVVKAHCETLTKEVRIDNDVGISITLDIDNTLTVVSLNTDVPLYKSYEEVGMSPGLIIDEVFSTATIIARNETSQGDIYKKSSTIEKQYIYNERKMSNLNAFSTNYKTREHNQTYTKSYFRIDRSRFV